MTRIIVPGYKGSPKGHWQYWLQEILADAVTVEQKSWDFPEMNQWVEELNRTIESVKGPVQLVGHSMGVITILFWAKKYGKRNVHSAVLVAPADSESSYLPKEIQGFSPIPHNKLPFPAVLVGSHNDPYMSFERAVLLANSIGAEFIDAGFAGHINIDAGFGPWPELLPVLEKAESVSDRKTFTSKNFRSAVEA